MVSWQGADHAINARVWSRSVPVNRRSQTKRR